MQQHSMWNWQSVVGNLLRCRMSEIKRSVTVKQAFFLGLVSERASQLHVSRWTAA